MSDDSDSKIVVYVLAGLGILMVLLVCGGLLAAIAIPEFSQTLVETKAREGEAIVETTVGAVESHYHRTGSLPGVGSTVRTAPEPPVAGKKHEVDMSHLSDDQRAVWKQLDWPAEGTPMYFQYVYRAESTGEGQRAVIVGRSDFEEGGPVHTVRRTISLEGDDLKVAPVEVENEFQ